MSHWPRKMREPTFSTLRMSPTLTWGWVAGIRASQNFVIQARTRILGGVAPSPDGTTLGPFHGSKATPILVPRVAVTPAAMRGATDVARTEPAPIVPDVPIFT